MRVAFLFLASLSLPEGRIALVEYIQYPHESLSRLVFLTFVDSLFGYGACELHEIFMQRVLLDGDLR